MGVLQELKKGTLYNMDCIYLLEAEYKRESLDTIVFVFSQKPPEDFPRKFFLMPEGKQYDFRAFIYTLTEEIHPCRLFDNRDVFIVRAVTNDIPEQRKNFRVYATFRAMLFLEGSREEISVKVKDVGTGGFQFVSEQDFQPGTILIAVFPDLNLKFPLQIKAKIQKMRPVRREGLHGYGCQYIDLQPRDEAVIRNYVFQTEVLQAKARKEMEEYSMLQ